MAITGGCLCGAVRYRTEKAILTARACWCRDCQYLAAGGATINLIVPTEGMAVTGTTGEYRSLADSGSHMRRRFCAACGTPMFSEAEERPDVMVVRAGTLDDPEMGRPGATIWTASAPSWACIDPDLPTTPGQPAPVRAS